MLPIMELDLNLHLTNFRSSMILAQILNLTYSMPGNLTSSLMNSTTSTNTDAGESFDDVTSEAMSVSRSSSQTNLGLKGNGRNGRRDNSEAEMLEMFNKYFATVIDPVVIAIGIVGNALLALVFMITPLRLQPLSHVLSGLGVVDLIYMLSYMLMYMTKNGANVYEVPGACQILTFILVLTKCIEAWYIFLSHLNRLKSHASARSELLRLRVFNTKFAIIMIAILVAAPLLHTLWSMETLQIAATTYCVPMRETLSVYLTLRKIEVIATVLLPILLIAGVDVALLIKFITFFAYTKDVAVEGDEIKNNLNVISTSCSDNKITVLVLQDDCSQDESENENAENNPMTPSNDLSPACHITDHVRKEVPAVYYYASDVDSLHYNNNDDVYSSDMNKCMGVPKNISISTTSLDDNSIQLSTQLSEPYHTSNCDLNHTLPMFEAIKLNSTSTDSENTEDVDEEKTKSLIDISKQESEQNKRDLSSSLEMLNTTNSNTQYNFTSSLINSLSKCRSDTNIHSEKQDNYNREGIQISKYTVNNGSYKNIYSTSNYANNNSISDVCITARNQVTHEDHVIPNDTTACTLTIMLLGVIFAITLLPSTYTQAVRLFFQSPTTRPTFYEIQLAILFESFVKINAVYKIFLYTLTMPSFRSAIMWLLTHWIPNKITRIYSLCLWGAGADKNQQTYV